MKFIVECAGCSKEFEAKSLLAAKRFVNKNSFDLFGKDTFFWFLSSDLKEKYV